MRTVRLLLVLAAVTARADDAPMPRPAEGWAIDLVARAPEVLYPTAIVASEDGTLYVGQDPMDMPGPPTAPGDSVVALRPDGRRTIFASRLWAVMGLEWADGTLFVVHAPYLSAFRDADGDGLAESRVDLVTGLGPAVPGFNGINDHIASGVRLGMDGFLYIAVGDKGLPRAVGRDGKAITLFGGGVIRVRPDGSDLQIVSTGERNPLSVMLTVRDDLFTYGNDDDSKRWPNSLTHHIVGGHYGYPYEFLLAPRRCLPIVAGQIGGAGAQGVAYNEDGLPDDYRGNLFVCDWGLQAVERLKIRKAGGTCKLVERTPLVEKGDLDDFRPFSIAVAPGGGSLYLADWAFNGWLADGPQTGRIYRLTYNGPDRSTPAPRPKGDDPASLLAALDHPAHSVRLGAQRRLARDAARTADLTARLEQPGPATGRVHALWALDAIGRPDVRRAVRLALADADAEVRREAARSAGQRRDRGAVGALARLLDDRDAAVRREAAIAIGRIGDASAGPALWAHLDETDAFAAWSVRRAIRDLAAWDVPALTAALLDPGRRENALALADASWAVPAVDALVAALGKEADAEARAEMVGVLGGLYRRDPPWSGQWFGTNPLAGRMPQKTEDWDPDGMRRVLAGLTARLDDADRIVRLRAIEGMKPIGAASAGPLRARLTQEADGECLAALAGALGAIRDRESATALAALAMADRPLPTRLAALDALEALPGPEPLRARLGLLYAPSAPAVLVSRAIPSLSRAKVLPPNDLGGFLWHREPAIRAAALQALAEFPAVSADLRTAVVDKLADESPEVRRAAVGAAAALRLREAIPALLPMARAGDLATEATLALAAAPDPRATAVYLAALADRSSEVRRAGESALRAIRDEVGPELEATLRAGTLAGPAAEAVERVLTRFRPITDWRVIGPFPRTVGRLFVGEPSIDFARTLVGAGGRPIAWTRRDGALATGRVVIDDLKGGAGDRGGFGYDGNGSPDLGAFGYAEVSSAGDRLAWLLIGSSGTISVTVNEQVVLNEVNVAGRPYRPDSDRVRVRLRAGRNRILVQARQGIGVWSFGVQVSEPATTPGARSADLDALRRYALEHDGDPRRGARLFFEPEGIGCVKCHAVGGKGGGKVGPDLAGLAKKYGKAELILSVLEPSRRIANGYQPALVATTDGRVLNGLVRDETAEFLDLVDSDARVTRVPKAQVGERRVGDVSTMPTGLVDALKPEEFADLIAYLASLTATP